MVGYVIINQAEMKFKDYEVYHSFYCGLCKCLKDRYGRSGQMTLSFDMTFLIILLSGLYEPQTDVNTTTCVTHPLTKHTTRTNQFTEYAADMNLLLTYYKCLDDFQDEGKKSRLAMANTLKKNVKHIRKAYPKKARVISNRLKTLSRLEKKNEKNIDKMAGLFGDIMAEIFAYRADEWEGSLRKIGFFLGKFVYLMDAYDDVEKDSKSGNYNPFKEAFANADESEFAEHCKSLLTLMMAECSREFEQLPILLYTDILRNILYSGVWSRYDLVTEKRSSSPDEPDTKTTRTA